MRGERMAAGRLGEVRTLHLALCRNFRKQSFLILLILISRSSKNNSTGLAHHQQMGEPKRARYKVLMLGAAGVGKLSLIHI